MARKRRERNAPVARADANGGSTTAVGAGGGSKATASARGTSPDGSTAATVFLRTVAAAIAFFGLIPVGNYLGAGPATPFWSDAVAQWLRGSTVLLVVAAGAAFALRDRVDSLIDRCNQLIVRPPPRIFGAMVAAFAVALTAAISIYAFDGGILWGDEFSQRFQARVLLSGRLSAMPEQHLEFFNTAETLDRNGRWFSQFPIGAAIFLAAGDAVGAPWMVNPIFMGWTAWNVYRFAAGAAGERFARWTTLLFALSPFPVFLAATQMNHASALAFITWGLAALPTWATSDDPRQLRRSAFVLGVAFGVAATIRPFDAALCAAAVGVFQLLAARRSPERRASLAWQTAAGILPIAILFYANWRTTGSPLLFGYDALNGAAHRPGFHEDPRGELHTPVRGIALISAYLTRLNLSLLESPVPALLFVTAGMALVRRTGLHRWDGLLASMIVLVTLGYATYWHEGYLIAAPRFLHIAIPAFIWFTASAHAAASERLTNPHARRTAVLLLPLCVSAAWLKPHDPNSIYGVWTALSPYHDPKLPRPPDVAEEARQAGLDNALVFVRESWHGSLAARLRALGAEPLRTEMFIPAVDACALQVALDQLPPGAAGLDALEFVQHHALAAGEAEPVPGREGRRDVSLSLVPGRPLEPVCDAELALDRVQPVPYAMLLADADFDADGRLGGRVVFARDLGARNPLLRARFGDRNWYRYVPSPGEANGEFIPIDRD